MTGCYTRTRRPSSRAIRWAVTVAETVMLLTVVRHLLWQVLRVVTLGQLVVLSLVSGRAVAAYGPQLLERLLE